MDDGTTAAGRLTTSSGIYRVDGTKVANGAADLFDGSIAAAVNVNEFGAGTTGFSVWTGSNSNGLAAKALGNSFTLPFFPFPPFDPLPFPIVLTDSTYGSADATGDTWLSTSNLDQSNTYHLYAFSNELTVPGTAAVPEPGTVALAAGGLAGMAAVVRRRRAKA